MQPLVESVIKERAYAIWEQEGRPDGREWDHWERALREIIGSDPVSPAPQPAVEGSAAAKPKRARGHSPARAPRPSRRRGTA